MESANKAVARNVLAVVQCRSDQGIHCLLTEYSIISCIGMKYNPAIPMIRNGFVQIIRNEKSIHL